MPPPSDEAIHQVPVVERPRRRDAVGKSQRHGGVVGPPAGRLAERAAPDHVFQSRLRVAGAELERRAHRVAHRQTEERPERPALDGVRGPRRNRGRPRRALRHVGLLKLVLDGSPPNVAHAADRVVRASPQLHQQPGGDGPGAAQAPLAMDQHVEPQPQPVPDGLARHRPRLFEVGSRRHPVGDRREPPLHVPVADRLGETAYRQLVDLLVGDQAEHHGRPPAPDRVEVGIQIARRGPRGRGSIGLAGAQRDADPALAVPRGHRGDAERAVLAGACSRHGMTRPRRGRQCGVQAIGPIMKTLSCAFMSYSAPFIRKLARKCRSCAKLISCYCDSGSPTTARF